MRKEHYLSISEFAKISDIRRKALIFYYVDKENDGSGIMKLFKKKLFHWYKKVIASNGKDLA